jgi:serine/threonine protein kinase
MLAIGQTLHVRYRIARLLGQGGMGAVYLAQNMQQAGRWVAIKEMIPDHLSGNAITTNISSVRNVPWTLFASISPIIRSVGNWIAITPEPSAPIPWPRICGDCLRPMHSNAALCRGGFARPGLRQRARETRPYKTAQCEILSL